MDREPSAPKPIEITPSTEVRDMSGNLVHALELSAERGTGLASGAVYLHIQFKPASAPASSAGAWKIERGELKTVTGAPIAEGSPAYGIKVAVESHFRGNPANLAALEEDLRNI